MLRKVPNWDALTTPNISLPKTCKVIYCHELADCSIICDEILNLDNVVAGFDLEWPVSYVKNKEDKVAVVQICIDLKCCYIFQVSEMISFPPMLKKLIENENFVKVGVNIKGDILKLGRNFGIDVDKAMISSVDLGTLANSVFDKLENWSMDALSRFLFEATVSKIPKVRKSKWNNFPLSQQQLNYAALDAYLSLKIYKELLKTKGTISI